MPRQHIEISPFAKQIGKKDGRIKAAELLTRQERRGARDGANGVGGYISAEIKHSDRAKIGIGPVALPVIGDKIAEYALRGIAEGSFDNTARVGKRIERTKRNRKTHKDVNAVLNRTEVTL